MAVFILNRDRYIEESVEYCSTMYFSNGMNYFFLFVLLTFAVNFDTYIMKN